MPPVLSLCKTSQLGEDTIGQALAEMAFSPQLNQPGGVELFECLFLDQYFSNSFPVTESSTIKHPSKVTWDFICMGVTQEEPRKFQHAHKTLERHASIFLGKKTLVYQGI